MQQFAFVTVSALCLALSAVESRAETDLPERGPIPFATYDQNGDGGISEDEFATIRAARISERAAEGRPMRGLSNAPQFADFDTDGDGSISPAELSAGQAARARGPRGMGPGGPGGQQPSFDTFDLNGDGVIVESELDQARSKRITERVSQGYPMRNLLNMPTFADIDGDGNGEITPDEFAAHQLTHRMPGGGLPVR